MIDKKQIVVKLDSNGELISCAKGLSTNACGYVAGAKICGKCGAVAIQAKIDEDNDMENEDMTPEELAEAMAEKMAHPMRKPAVATSMMSDEEDEEEETMEDEDTLDVDVEEEDEEEDELSDEDVEKMISMMGDVPDPQAMAVGVAKKKKKKMMGEMPMVEEDEDEEKDMHEEEEEEDVMAMRKKMRNRRLATLGYKSDDFQDEPFICQFDRKVYPSGHMLCDTCPGGCVSENGMPSLLEVEGIVEEAINGKVLDSGYTDTKQTYVLDVERKDGTPVEVFVDGPTGEIFGWHKIPMDNAEFKSANQGRVIIGFHDAADIAVKSVQGEVVAVEPDIFDGWDAYAVEIEGIDGKSYDVFVDLEGNVLGYDEYTSEEASEIESEAAEIALKRAYSEEDREMMAKQGTAMDDGSFPITNEMDLRNAIQAIGRAKDPMAAKMHCMKRAKALKMEDLIPANWDQEKSAESSITVGAEEGQFLSTLMEFEMLSAEISDDKPEIV